MKKTRGFTLIELMIVVAVVAILAAVAISQYGKQVRKGRRAEAKQAIATLAMAEEKWRMNHALYASCDDALGGVVGACNSFNGSLNAYTIAISGTPTATNYTITATPKGPDQPKDTCGTFTFSMASGVVDKQPTTVGCWR